MSKSSIINTLLIINLPMLKLRQGKEKYMDMDKCKGMCMCSKIGIILLIIGGLNWGLVGIGMLIGSNLNVINLLLSSVPTVEGIIYVLVGLAAIMKIFGCRCKKGMGGNTTCCGKDSGVEKMEAKM